MSVTTIAFLIGFIVGVFLLAGTQFLMLIYFERKDKSNA